MRSLTCKASFHVSAGRQQNIIVRQLARPGFANIVSLLHHHRHHC